MSTDRELDDRLAAAAGIRDADLPPLPEEFLAILRAQPDEPASVVAARQLVADAHRARTDRRSRRPRRKVLVRAGAGVLVIAATWTTAVLVVDRAGGERPPVATPATAPTPSSPAALPLDPPGGLALVAAEAVTFPYSLAPAPEGLTPVLTRSGGLEMFGTVDPVVYAAQYRSAEDLGFAFSVSPTDPRVLPPGVQESPPYTEDEVDQRGATAVAGRPADFVAATFTEPHCRAVPATPTQKKEPAQLCSDRYAELTYQRADGQWVQLTGQGDRYGRVPALVAVAESIVDRPQPVQLQVRLAPKGWLVSGYDSPTGLTLVDEAHPTSLSERISVSLQERWRGYDDPSDLMQGMAEGTPVEQVTVKGQAALLASVPDHVADLGSGKRTWNLAAQFPDGVQFLFQAPDTLSREDVLAMAEGLTYTP